MPLIFIHGVNVRDDDPSYHKEVAARDEMFRRLLLEPLAQKAPRCRNIEIVNPYWGKHGARFHWNLATVPDVSVLEHLGGDEGATSWSDLDLAAIMAEFGRRAGEESPLESLGAEAGPLTRAARADLTRLIEGVLGPIILSEQDLYLKHGEDAEAVGKREALLLIAGEDVAHDPMVQQKVAAASSDDEIMDLLEEAIQQRYETLLLDSDLLSPTEIAVMAGHLEGLGPDWIEDLKSRAGELFARAKGALGRAATIPVLALARESAHRALSQFLGDVFVYLDERGESDAPGPIVQEVLGGIRNAPRHHPDEPLIAVTHSMGGNILYEILTTYGPDLEVDVWVSVGGQVGQFEEMKLFKSSDDAVRAPDRVAGLSPRVGLWLNVYDPADSLSFKAEPVFDDVEDVVFLTGSSAVKSHGDYFKRPSFYRLLRERVEGALT